MLPNRAPATEAEVQQLFHELSLAPVNVPGKLEIISYREREILSLRSAAPFFPCEGLPAPRFSGLAWPLEIQTQIRAGKGKLPIKYMMAKLSPVRIPQVDVYVLARRMTGTFEGEVQNIGEVVLAMSNLANWLRAKAFELLRGARASTPAMEPARALKYTVGFELEGWDMIKELWNYMWTRTIAVTLNVEVNIPGYETPEYSVDPFYKRFDVEATLPVEDMNWHVW